MREPVFIVGCDRSGTTLLRLMLNQSECLHIPQESGFLPELRDSQKEYGDFTLPRQRWFFIRDLQRTNATHKTIAFDIFSLSPDEAEKAIAAVMPTDYAGASAALFQASARKRGKSRWGDKTPRYVKEVAWLASVFPNSKFVHIIRDSRDVVMSIRRAGWNQNFREAADFWNQRVNAGREAGKQLGESVYREVQYEELVHHPEEQLKSLCSWLDLSYTPAMMKFYEESEKALPKEHMDLFPLAKKPIDTSRAFAWKRSMRHQAIADVEEVTGDLLRELDYDLSGAKTPIWLAGLRWSYEKVRPLAKRARTLAHKMTGIAYYS